jgi:hypothetical protein
MSRRIKLVFAVVVLILVTAVVLILVTCNLLLSTPAPPPGWETYTDRNLGFSFSYPKSFNVSQSNHFSDPYCKTIILAGPSSESIEIRMNSRQLVGSSSTDYNQRSDELHINGFTIEKTVLYEDKPSSPAFVIYSFNNRSDILWVGVIPGGDTKAEPLYESIIGTFAPLPPTPNFWDTIYKFLFGPLGPPVIHTC